MIFRIEFKELQNRVKALEKEKKLMSPYLNALSKRVELLENAIKKS